MGSGHVAGGKGATFIIGTAQGGDLGRGRGMFGGTRGGVAWRPSCRAGGSLKQAGGVSFPLAWKAFVRALRRALRPPRRLRRAILLAYPFCRERRGKGRHTLLVCCKKEKKKNEKKRSKGQGLLALLCLEN